MPFTVDLPFSGFRSGKITHTPPSSYVAARGYASCQTGQNVTAGTKWRAFFGFDASALPDIAIMNITKVELLVRLADTQPPGAPQTYALKISIGTWVGATLDGTAAEYDGGTLMVTLAAKPGDGTLIDLAADGQDPTVYINRGAGGTDIKVWDDSTRGTGDASWGINFNTSVNKCILRITYTVPVATLTGVGSLTCAGTVTAMGSATLVGRGSLTCAGSVSVHGSAALVGKGTLTCTGRATHPPLAQHHAAASVGGVQSATRSVEAANEATRTIDLVDSEP